KTYRLIKFKKTNQSTCINLKPIVKKGQQVEKGQVLCEGYATQNGELALGRNLKVAFMPWQGFNFEDAIVISERVVSQDIFTSSHPARSLPICVISTRVRTRRSAIATRALLDAARFERKADRKSEGHANDNCTSRLRK